MKKISALLLSLLFLLITFNIPSYAYSTSVDVDGDGKADGTLTDEVTCFVVVPSSVTVGDDSGKVYIAGRAYASATLSIPTSVTLSDGKGNSLPVTLKFGSGTNRLSLPKASTEKRVVSTTICSSFDEEPLCGNWSGRIVYTFSSQYQNPYEELVFTLSSDGTYYIVGTGKTTNSNGLVKKTAATGKVSIPSTYNGKPVKEIGQYSFYKSGITSVVMPSSIIKVGNHAFDECTSLTAITYSKNITSIGTYAFANTTSYKTALTLPTALKSIGQGAYYRSAITSVTVPSNLTSLSTHCFSNNMNLTSATIPSTMKTIGSCAFVNTSIKKISIPSGCTYTTNSFPDGCTVTKS